MYHPQSVAILSIRKQFETSCKQFILLLYLLLWNVQTSGQYPNWNEKNAFKKKKKMRCKYDLKSLFHVLNHSSSRNNNNVIKTSLKEKRGYNWMRIYA